MATLALTALASSLGANAFWMAAAGLAGGYLDNKLFGPETEGPRLKSLQVQSSSLGSAIPKVYGKGRVGGQVLWGTDFVEHKKEESSGGKGGGGTVTTFTYSTSFAVAICQGPIQKINRIWADGNPFNLYKTNYSVSGDLAKYLFFTNVTAYSSDTWSIMVSRIENNVVYFSIKDAAGNSYPEITSSVAYSNEKVAFTLSPADYVSLGAVVVPGMRCTLHSEVTSTAVCSFTLYPGTEDQRPNSFMESHLGVGQVPAYKGLAYIVFQDFYVDDYGDRVPSFSFEVVNEDVSLGNILLDISEEAGLLETDVDFTALNDISVPGYIVSQENTFRDRIQELQQVYQFDVVEAGGKIIGKPRNLASYYTVPWEDIGAYEVQKSGDALSFCRNAEIELPKTVWLTYISSENSYQQGVVNSKRNTTLGKVTKWTPRPLTKYGNDAALNCSVVLTSDQAKKSVDASMYQSWLNRTTITTVLGSKWAFLSPGDNVQFEDAYGNLHMAMLTKCDYGRPGLLKITAVTMAGAVYATTEYTTADVYVQPVPDNSKVANVVLEFLDIPRLPTDTGDYTANTPHVAATSASFVGANVFRSQDGGSTYSLFLQIGQEAKLGFSNTVLASGPTNYFDAANTLTITMLNGATLESRTKNAILNGYNSAVLGNEIIQYTTAELISTNTYLLSGLLRGRLGTEDQIGNHVAGERFVALSSLTVPVWPDSASDIGISEMYLYGPATQPNSDVTYTKANFTDSGRAYKPYAVCHVNGVRDSAGNLTISWIRRTRYNGDWTNNSDVPLNEKTEKYSIDILKGTTILRMIEATSASVIYEATQQLADFGSLQASVKVRIYQISEIVGRGIVKEAIL